MSKTTAKTTATANNAKFDKVLAMNDLIKLAHDNQVCFLASNNKSNQYRIFNGKSSLHIQKTQYKVFATDADLKLFGEIDDDNRKFTRTDKNTDIQCEIDTNLTDGVRPNIIYIKPNAIDYFLKTLSKNKLNQMQ